MTVLIETSGDKPYVKELTIRTGAEGVSAAQSLARIDPAQLALAFRPEQRQPAPPAPQKAQAKSAKGTAERRPAKTRKQNAAKPRPARTYRRAPEFDELAKVYDEVGTITGVASHYDVPVHTAQGWVTRMRNKAEQHSGADGS
ncbi:hypothetical protein [Amycolatopsis sp. CA-230715]|uniref:hypothetical protein n=1 Tax=Amycolatopsis sp. CA-230715 TaxID=2745196 RepID=UPI001C02FB17|nr:hypothetical protein [Amycolatopsis sp. CA-230715]